MKIINEGNIKIRREESTDEKKRIDIVIISDDFVIGIENKVHASINNNPFCDYAKHLNSLGKDSKEVRKVLLSLRPEQPSPKLCGFQPVSYELFLNAIGENFESYSQNAEAIHVTFLKDFIQTMQNLQKTSTIDPQWLKYFHDKDSEIKILLAEIDVFRKDISRKLKYLEQIIADDVEFSTCLNKSHTWTSPRVLAQSLIYRIEPNKFPLCFAISLASTGWSLQFWNQDSRNKDLNKDKETKNWFKERGIEVEDRLADEGTPWLLEYKGEDFKLPYETDSEDIKIFVSQIWGKLNKTSQE